MGLFGDMFGHNDAERWHEEVYNTPQYVPEKHEGSWTHEAIAGAAGFAAMKSYEDHLRKTGQEPSHALMKELLAGFAAAEVDKLAETKGLDYLDREKAKRHAVEQAHHLANERYGHNQNGVDYARQQYGGQGYGGYNQGGYGAPQPGQFGGYDGQGGYGVQQVGMGNYGGPPPEMAYGGQQGYGGGYGGPPQGEYGGGYGGPPQGQYGGGYGGPPQGYEGGEHHHHHHHRRD